MRLGLIPRETKFFDMLGAQAAVVVKGAKLLNSCLESHTSLEAISQASKEIHEIEHEGDEIVHQLLARINKSFITPLDREDLYELTVRLDDVLDFIDAVAKRLVTFKISEPTPQALELSRIIVRSSEEVQEGISLLRDLKNPSRILRQCEKINQLENEADQVMREALNGLFNGVPRDVIDVIKWKDLYEHLEVATDKCEDVANIIEAVLVKYT
jgi:predicted phosphate transport protein (TIGR00153 family)